MYVVINAYLLVICNHEFAEVVLLSQRGRKLQKNGGHIYRLGTLAAYSSLGGSEGMLSRNILKFRCSEVILRLLGHLSSILAIIVSVANYVSYKSRGDLPLLLEKWGVGSGGWG